MAGVLVTGATGLIGSNVCAVLVEQGADARALVREGSDATQLEALGARVVRGDVTVLDDVVRASEDCSTCIHTAALVVGGPSHPYADYEAVNVRGTENVLAAAQQHGFRRTVCLTTSASFDRSETLTEQVRPLSDRGGDDPYAATKLLAWEAVMRRFAEGMDVVSILPGGYGPAPTLRRAIEPPGLNDRIVRALTGRVDTVPPMRSAPILASDVARSCVAALTRGIAGESYLLMGRPEDVVDTATVLNLAIAAAGRPYQVRALTEDELRTDEAMARWGPSVIRSTLESPEPPFDNRHTVEQLGHDPTPLPIAIERTVAWMLDHGFA